MQVFAGVADHGTRPGPVYSDLSTSGMECNAGAASCSAAASGVPGACVCLSLPLLREYGSCVCAMCMCIV